MNPPPDYPEKFKGFIEMCDEAKAKGISGVVVAFPGVIGDNYEEVIESLSRLADAGLTLSVAKRAVKLLAVMLLVTGIFAGPARAQTADDTLRGVLGGYGSGGVREKNVELVRGIIGEKFNVQSVFGTLGSGKMNNDGSISIQTQGGVVKIVPSDKQYNRFSVATSGSGYAGVAYFSEDGQQLRVNTVDGKLVRLRIK